MSASAEQNRWIARVLGVAPPSSGGATLAAWQAARDGYVAALAAVDAQITALQRALEASQDDDLEQIAGHGLSELLNADKDALAAALHAAGSNGGDKLGTAAPRIVEAARAFRARLEADARIAACDDNPFGVTVAIRHTLGTGLEALEQAAGRALNGA